jgi:hypothetical protein
MNTSTESVTRALLDLGFGTRSRVADTSRPLAWLSAEELAIDLADPVQRRFGDYELIERIGQGGMGVVYRARQHGLERDVAVKLLAAGPWASAEFVERFRREARSAARMQHPNIVEIYEFGHRDGLNYFSMRLIEGESLAQKLARDGVMKPMDAARLLRIVAEAMDYAHRLGVLHLDLKPANVLLTADGVPLVADFGLARRIDAGHEGGGEISGTPSYMAPEQALLESHPLSASTDIYGLGAILYECLTGRPPFLGADAHAVLEHVATEAPVAPRALRRQVPRDLEAICLKCLEKAPASRYASARELADDLGRFVEGRAVGAHPLNPAQRLARWVRREPRLAAAVTVALVAFAAGVLATRMQWERAETALANAEFLELASIFPRAPSEDIERLLTEVHTRLSEERRRRLVGELGASDDADRWLEAGLIGNTLDAMAPPLGGEAVRRAVAARPDDPLALLVANEACDAGDCPVPDAAERLARLQPDNLFPWLEAIDGPGLDLDAEGRWAWRAEHDPAFRARIRALIAHAARATRWDDGGGRMARMKAAALGASFVRFPDRSLNFSVEPRRSWHLLLDRSIWQFDYDRLWLGRWSGTNTLQRLCRPPDKGEMDPGLREDCHRIGRLLLDHATQQWYFAAGARILHRLEPGSREDAEVFERLRRLHWIRTQSPWTFERDPIGAGKVYLQDWETFGEMEAMARQLDRVGIPRDPPAAWHPGFDWADTPNR